MDDEESIEGFAALLKEANPTVVFMFRELQQRHGNNLPAAIVAASMLLGALLKVSNCPVSAQELVDICLNHMEVYRETH